VVLFERTKQGIRSTKEGHKLYKLASDLILQNHQLEVALTPSNKIERCLYIQSDINVERYACIIEAIKNTSFDIELSVVDLIEQAQLAIIDEQRTPPQFTVKVLAQEGYKLLLRKDHPLANNNEINLNMLDGLTFIERPYCTNRKAFERLINENNISINYKGKAIHDLQLQGLVKLGLGLAVVPESYMHADESLEYISIALDLPITRSIVLAYRKLPSDLIKFLKEMPFVID
jgi:DNA-binding transcriptional LysR family regulator